jgi:hypothetical protein
VLHCEIVGYHLVASILEFDQTRNVMFVRFLRMIATEWMVGTFSLRADTRKPSANLLHSHPE